MEYIRKFENLSRNDVGLAGGKGASLGEMTKAGIPVPPGFVILSETFEVFLEKADLIQEIEAVLHTVDHQQIHTVENASEKIHALIMLANIPEDIRASIEKEFTDLNAEFVAVRSSATAEDSAAAAWAGQLESYLNTTKENLIENVKKCWASLFTPRAIFYRFEKELHGQKISVAVVVQKMVQAETAGVAFSVHPVTQDRNQLIIEAVTGLGEALVSGQVTPDSYVVEKDEKRIIDKNIQDATQKLSDEEIFELSKLVIHIENHYGFPVDVEWAREKGKFYIVQSRPITTLSNEKLKKRIFEKQYTRDNVPMSFQVWNENQTRIWKTLVGWEAPTFFLEAKDGVVDVYYEPEMFADLEKHVGYFLKNNIALQKILDDYDQYLTKLELIWKQKEALKLREELIHFYDLAVRGWSGMALSYFIPTLPAELATLAQREHALKNRERGGAYFEDTDRIIRSTLRSLYPGLGELAEYIVIEELRSDQLPDKSVLEKRKKQYLFFENQLIIDQKAEAFARERNIELRKPIADPQAKEIQGECAMQGWIRGLAKVIFKKSQLGEVYEGDILVTAMTTPDYLPAMNKAVAFVTDEGGVTCHAAIVARELKKPCVIGTKFATQLIKDGDEVEVDADQGVVRILKRA